MTYDQLELLEMIVEKGSFKAAAEALHKTQPTVSIAIKNLEEEFDLQLFNRETYRPTLTPAGEVFYQRSRAALEGFRTLKTLGRELGTQKFEARLTLALDPLVRMVAIEGIFDQCFRPNHPTELILRNEVLSGASDLLLEQSVDFAVAPLFSEHADIESVLMEKVELVPCIRADRLPSSGKITMGVLKEQVHIIVRSGSSEFAKAPSIGLLDLSPRCYVTDHSMKKQLILQGMGWGRLARHEMNEELSRGELALIPALDPALKVETLSLYLMRNKRKAMGPIAKAVWQRLLQKVPPHSSSSGPKHD